MKRTLFLLLIMVFLTSTTSVALAKPGKNMDLVCWTNTGGDEQSAYFMTTGSGIIHRFKDDGRHDVYKPVLKFDMPDKGAWFLWKGKAQDPCGEATPATYNQYLEDGVYYWHQHN